LDEAHKLSATRDATLRVRKSKRYLLAEALAGIPAHDERWQLRWHPRHLLLLTATPHMGKDFPYYALWRLLEPQVLSTYDAFQAFPSNERQRRFIRRTKEEMVKLDGSPLYPQRTTDTLTYDLTQGDASERALYDGTTEYLRTLYNRARMMNRSAARLALGVFQRRLASSTYALLRSLERRLARLDQLISDVLQGKITLEQLLELQRRRAEEEEDPFEAMTADEEQAKGGKEENEIAEEIPLASVIATSVQDLLKERDKVRELIALARKVDESGQESKFERLREIILDPRYANEKLLIFTEHRDTAEFLIRRLNGIGYAQQIAMIHGGLDYAERTAQVARFRAPAEHGGARFMVCTDAAGEGINLQFCWIMVNYDIPWNPARLEQRMGRIHRLRPEKGKGRDPEPRLVRDA
jgi:SNF2 family DNA or RNA helicase